MADVGGRGLAAVAVLADGRGGGVRQHAADGGDTVPDADRCGDEPGAVAAGAHAVCGVPVAGPVWAHLPADVRGGVPEPDGGNCAAGQPAAACGWLAYG